MHQVSIYTKQYSSTDKNLVNIYLYNHHSVDTIHEPLDNKVLSSEESADLAIYYYCAGEFDKSKSLLLFASVPYSYLNYAILYDSSYFKIAFEGFSDNQDIIYHYIENCILVNDLKDVKTNLGLLFKKQDLDIGSHIFNLGFMFQDQLSDYKTADVCFKFLARLNPKNDFNQYWIKEGIRCLPKK